MNPIFNTDYIVRSAWCYYIERIGQTCHTFRDRKRIFRVETWKMFLNMCTWALAFIDLLSQLLSITHAGLCSQIIRNIGFIWKFISKLIPEFLKVFFFLLTFPNPVHLRHLRTFHFSLSIVLNVSELASIWEFEAKVF